MCILEWMWAFFYVFNHVEVGGEHQRVRVYPLVFEVSLLFLIIYSQIYIYCLQRIILLTAGPLGHRYI